MQVNMNDFSRFWKLIESHTLNSVSSVGASGWWILGKEVEKFEKDLASFWGVKEAVGCASGLDALEICLRSLGVKEGFKVITTPLTAFATTLAIIRVGAVPVFCDVDESGLIDLNLVRKVLQSDLSVKHLLPVHLYGFAVSQRDLESLKNEFDLTIIEDCAQSISSTSEGRPTGSVGNASATSFYPTKNLGAIGDAGAVLTGSREIAAKSKMIRDYGQKHKFVHQEFGMNSRLDELQAGILRNAILPKLPQFQSSRSKVASKYLNEINNKYIKPLTSPYGCVPSWHLFPVTVDSNKRDVFRSYLGQHGIESGIHYPHLTSDQPIMNSVEFEIPLPLSRASNLARSVVTLPIHPFLYDEELTYVTKICNLWDGC